MKATYQIAGPSPFPEIKHFTSKICGVEAPKETIQNVKRSNWRPTHDQADVKTPTIRPDDPEIDRLLTQLGL